MYQQNQHVLYGIHGICKIVDIEEKTIDRQKVKYYVLEPLEQSGSRYYVPMDKPAAVAKLSPMLTPEELQNLFSQIEPAEKAWITDENARKLQYRQLIGSGDRAALLAMVNALYRHRDQQAALGKKFHQCDDNFLRDAEKLLSAEIAAVLEISQQEATDYMMKHLT